MKKLSEKNEEIDKDDKEEFDWRGMGEKEHTDYLESSLGFLREKQLHGRRAREKQRGGWSPQKKFSIKFFLILTIVVLFIIFFVLILPYLPYIIHALIHG